MNQNQRTTLITLAVMGLTIGAGLLTWWTFLPIAFGSGFYLARAFKTWKVVLMAGVAPAAAWLVSGLTRDLIEGFRISHKLAGLLHIYNGAFVYLALFIMVAVPSCLAAFSGNGLSKALR